MRRNYLLTPPPSPNVPGEGTSATRETAREYALRTLASLDRAEAPPEPRVGLGINLCSTPPRSVVDACAPSKPADLNAAGPTPAPHDTRTSTGKHALFRPSRWFPRRRRDAASPASTTTSDSQCAPTPSSAWEENEMLAFYPEPKFPVLRETSSLPDLKAAPAAEQSVILTTHTLADLLPLPPLPSSGARRRETPRPRTPSSMNGSFGSVQDHSPTGAPLTMRVLRKASSSANLRTPSLTPSRSPSRRRGLLSTSALARDEEYAPSEMRTSSHVLRSTASTSDLVSNTHHASPQASTFGFPRGTPPPSRPSTSDGATRVNCIKDTNTGLWAIKEDEAYAGGDVSDISFSSDATSAPGHSSFEILGRPAAPGLRTRRQGVYADFLPPLMLHDEGAGESCFDGQQAVQPSAASSVYSEDAWGPGPTVFRQQERSCFDTDSECGDDPASRGHTRASSTAWPGAFVGRRRSSSTATRSGAGSSKGRLGEPVPNGAGPGGNLWTALKNRLASVR